MDDSITQLKRRGLINDLQKRDIIIQEEESVDVYNSREIGFLFRVHPNYCARDKIIEEFQDYIAGEIEEHVSMRLKLVNRYFGNKKEGAVKTQYLAIYVDTNYAARVAKLIGRGLERGELLGRWGKVRLLPTSPSLHAKYDKEKFYKILQIHNMMISSTKKITIKNMWVADTVLPYNEGLLEALGLEKNVQYTLRELIINAAILNDYNRNDFFFSGYNAYLVTNQENYTEICTFIDRFIQLCEEYYGETEFATLLRSKDPQEARFRPQRSERPVYTSQAGVDELISNIGPKVRLLKQNTEAKKTYTNVRQGNPKGRNWAMVVSTSPQQSQTSPITLTTGETKSRFENIERKLNELTNLYKKEKNDNDDKMKKITDDINMMKTDIRNTYETQQQNTRSIESLIKVMEEQKHEMDDLNSMFRSMIQKLVYNKEPEQEEKNTIDGEYNSMGSYCIDVAMTNQETSTVSSQSGGKSKRGIDETRAFETDEPPPTRRLTSTQSSKNLLKIQKLKLLTQPETQLTHKKKESSHSDHLTKGGQKSP